MNDNQASFEQSEDQTKIPQITSSIISFGSSYCSLGCYKFPPDARSTRRADIKFVKKDPRSLKLLYQSRARTSESACDGKMVSRKSSGRVSIDAQN